MFKRNVFCVAMNNNTGAGGNMIMTNSSMSTMAGMAGGGLVVSSSVNKPLANATNILAPGPHHPGVPQVSLSVAVQKIDYAIRYNHCIIRFIRLKHSLSCLY